jgi:hypothetical protein
MTFDLRTKRYNKKGQVISDEPYIMYVENGKQVFERPPHSGNFYYIDGSEVDSEDMPEQTHTAQQEQKEARRAKATAEQTRRLNKTLKDHGKKVDSQEGGIMDPPQLDDADQAALDAMIDDEEQISATQPKSKTNAEQQKKA